MPHDRDDERPADEPSRHVGLHRGAAPPLARWHPATVIAFLWANLAVSAARRGYRRGLDHIRIPGPPPLPPGAARGVTAALRRRRVRCLTSAAVRQVWERSHGHDRALVIGVTLPSAGFSAHAWLEGDPPCCAGAGFTELTRR